MHTRNLEALTEDVEVLAREDRLEDIPGIGADLAGKIREYLRTGRVAEIAAASKGIPRGVVELMNVPGIGPKTAKLLHERQGITSVNQLEKLAQEGELRGLPGIQAKTEQNILKGIRLVRAGQERMPLGRELVHALERLPGVKEVSLAGSIRRMKDTVGDMDILVTSAKPEADGSLDYADSVLAQLDLVIAAVHARLTQSKAEMTRRVCRALAHPRVHVLAHPTGRLIGKRERSLIDLEEVFRAARRHDKALEVNAHPERLDLDDVHARRAHELGGLVAVSTDTHVLDDLAWTRRHRSPRARRAQG